MPSPPRTRALPPQKSLALTAVCVLLSLATACGPKAPPTSPAPPPANPAPPPEARVSANPPTAAIAEPADGAATTPPRWEDVHSGHPDGGTRPPQAILAVTADGARCYKQWRAGMMGFDPEVLAIGGRVIKPGETAKGTEIACPPQAAQVLTAYRARRTNP
jgi:hypothetical protein